MEEEKKDKDKKISKGVFKDLDKIVFNLYDDINTFKQSLKK